MSSTAETYISILLRSPQQQQQQPPSMQPSQSTQTQEKPFAWRMYTQPERKYQLFPKDTQHPPPVPGKGLDPEQALVLAMGPGGSDKAAPATNGLRVRIKEHNLTRRRKISVPELGPMTTVQEVAMDSPTIPGRPPLHERSISAPGNSWKQHHLVACMLAHAERDEENAVEPPRCSSAQAVLSPAGAAAAARQPSSPRTLAPLVIPANSHSASSRPAAQSRTRTGSTPYTPHSALTTPQSAASAASAVPSSASTLPTPLSAATATATTAEAEARTSPRLWLEGKFSFVTTPKESSPDAASSSNNMMSKATSPDAPQRSASAMAAPVAAASATVTLGHRRGQSESGSIMERGRPPRLGKSRENAAAAAAAAMLSAASAGVGTTTSKTSTTSTTTTTTATAATTATTTSPVAAGTLKRSGSKANRKAFELLPRGCKASEAAAAMPAGELAALASQALQQAARFEVLRKEDVDNLSQELRSLDERTEYLRRTYTSLRAGRRNLHSRICQYLRSPRVAKFSHDAMLRQEEALAELDASIDDWVTKLEQAENRRTRVRQKLLEHVAAAATLAPMALVNSLPAAPAPTAPAPPAPIAFVSNTSCPNASIPVVSVSETLQLAMGIRAATVEQIASMATPTPPRSPTRMATTSSSSASVPPPLVAPVSSSLSPQRPIVSQVPSTILEQPLVEEALAEYRSERERTGKTDKTEKADTVSKGNKSSKNDNLADTIALSPLTSPVSALSRRVDVESIRIYAGDDVYALLADVEHQITQMSDPKISGLSDEERKQLHRAHSHELLNGGAKAETTTTTANKNTSASSTAANKANDTPIAHTKTNSPKEDDSPIFLTSAVFRPERSVLAI